MRPPGAVIGNSYPYEGAHILLAQSNLLYGGSMGPQSFQMNVLSRDAVSSGTVVYQAHWLEAYNDEWTMVANRVGHPNDFWNGATFEVINGTSKGVIGTVTDYTMPGDGSEPFFTLDTPVTLSAYDAIAVRKTNILVTRPGKVSIAYGSEIFAPVRSPSGGMVVQTDHVIQWYLEADDTDPDTDHDEFEVTLSYSGSGLGSMTVIVKRGATTVNQSVDSDTPTTFSGFSGEIGFIQVDVIVPAALNGQLLYLAKMTSPRSTLTRLADLTTNGTLRYWAEDAMGAPTFSALLNGTGTGGWKPDDRDGKTQWIPLSQILDWCTSIGAMPWVCLPTTWPAAEYQAAASYLLSTAFPLIGVEFGNELWGGGHAGDPFRGQSYADMSRVAEAVDYKFGQMKSGLTPTEQARFEWIIGGQSPVPANQAILDATTEPTAIALGPYFGRGDVTPGDAVDVAVLRAEAEDQDEVDANLLQISSKNVVIYEYNSHATLADLPAATINAFLATPQFGMILCEHSLRHLILGIDVQNIFTLYQNNVNGVNGEVNLWGILKTLDSATLGYTYHAQMRPYIEAATSITAESSDTDQATYIFNSASPQRITFDYTNGLVTIVPVGGTPPNIPPVTVVERTPRLGFPLMNAVAGERNAHITYNEFLLMVEVLGNTAVADIVNSPTISTNGTIYIVGSTPTGAFADLTPGSLVIAWNGGWLEVPARSDTIATRELQLCNHHRRIGRARRE